MNICPPSTKSQLLPKPPLVFITLRILHGNSFWLTSLPVLGEEIKKQQSQQVTDHKPKPNPATVLPFLGRSQSLLNIPINLDVNKPVEIKPPPVIQQTPQPVAAAAPHQQGTIRRNESSKRSAHHNKAECSKYQSLPHSTKEGSKSHRRDANSSSATLPARSKSVETNKSNHQQLQQQQQQQHQYDISQLELFATIHQSRQAVSSRSNSKNLTVTSALVGVRQSDRNGSSRVEQKTLKSVDPAANEKATPSASGIKNPSGHVCVVQALVHQDGDVMKNPVEPPRSLPQRPRTCWDPIYEPVSHSRSKTEENSSEASIELTADQVRQLIRAISAAQSGAGGSIGGCWPSEMGRATASHIPERDKPPSHQQQQQQRTLHRNDSFEGHEEAVRMLVGAIQEIQQLCTDKKPSDNQ